MKKLWILLPAAAMLSMVASAAPACLATQTYAQVAATGFSCEIGDKIFDNFNLGGLGSTAVVQFGQTGLTAFTITFADSSVGGLANSFTVSYRITIDPTQAPANTGTGQWAITRVAAGMQDSNGNGFANLTKNVTGGATGSAIANDVNGTITPTVLTGIKATTLNVSDVYTYQSGIITAITNTYTQADIGVPEPLTMSLMGVGLLAVGLLRRRVAR